MERVVATLLVPFVIFFLLPHSRSSPLPDRVYVRNATSPPPNKTISDLIQTQTDKVKKIVSNHNVEYPVVTRYSPDDKKKPEPQISLEELKAKCQHLARLATSTVTAPPPTSSSTSSPSGFYITSEATPPSPPPIKYIKLEPVILQKTIMSDGRTVYYWHKSIPSQIAPAPIPVPTTPTTTTTTTTEATYNFRNFFPSFYSIGGSESVGTTTTEKTATAEEVPMYQQQLKFVVPVPYAPPEESGVRKPWEIDQYAYYPKPLQPESVNVQMPYVPTFHVIKAIALPNQYEGAKGQDDFN